LLHRNKLTPPMRVFPIIDTMLHRNIIDPQGFLLQALD
jgi:hypothetical protein